MLRQRFGAARDERSPVIVQGRRSRHDLQRSDLVAFEAKEEPEIYGATGEIPDKPRR
jgi:hypothetical protein